MIELIATIVIMGVIILSLPQAMDSIAANSVRSERTTIAFFLAREKIEEIIMRNGELREVGYTRIVDQNPDAPFNGNHPFNLYRYRITIQFMDYGGAGFAPAAGATNYKMVTVRVYAPGLPAGLADPPTAILATLVANYGD